MCIGFLESLPIPIAVLPSPKDQLYSVSFRLLNLEPNTNGSDIFSTLVEASLNLKVLDLSSSILPVLLVLPAVLAVGCATVNSAVGAGGAESVTVSVSKSYCPVGLATVNFTL